jgi:O-antigen/teichoic acid export membrane protein
MIERIGGALRRKFVRDTLTLQAGKVGVLVLGILSSFIVPKLMGPDSYGTWRLGLSLYAIWQALNLTGLLPSAQTRLAAAVGSKDESELLNIMAFFVRVTLLYCAASSALLWVTRPLLANWLYDGDMTIPRLAFWLTLTQPTELIYHLFIITFSSRRQMRHVALLQNMNQTVLVGAAVGAVLVLPTPEAVLLSRLVYSAVTLVVTAAIYQRTRHSPIMNYPALETVLAFVPRASGTGYWRFGLTNALDKNAANLYTEIPLQMTGAVLGEAAAGYVGLALNALRQQTFFTSALMDNMQAVVPQWVGGGEYARLWRNFNRVLFVLLVGSVIFYGAFALAAPLFVQLLYGEEWLPAIPLVQALALYGAVATVGSVFAPLYRAFDYVRGALLIKMGLLAVFIPSGYLLMRAYGEIGTVWTMNLLFLFTVVLTAFLTLPELRLRAQEQAHAQAALNT